MISRPDVHSIQITKADNFLILACDGVWDVLSNQEAVSYVHRRLLIHRDVQRAAVELVNKVKPTGDVCWDKDGVGCWPKHISGIGVARLVMLKGSTFWPKRLLVIRLFSAEDLLNIVAMP